MAPSLLAMVESRLMPRPREDVDLGQHGVPLAGMIISVILAMLSLVIISSFLSKWWLGWVGVGSGENEGKRC